MRQIAILISALLALSTIHAALAQTVTAVTNAASFAPGEIAPGSIATIFGTNLSTVTAQATGAPWPTTLGGVTVQIDGGVAVPLYYVSPTQIDFQASRNLLNGLATTPFDVNVISGSGSNSFQVAASSAAPGVFVDPKGFAIAQNQDYSLNSATNPALVASYVTVYLTGIGVVDNRVADGAAAPTSPLSRPTLPVTASVGGQSASVLFAGLTPGYVGLAQANIQIPNLAPGIYPLVITVGAAASDVAEIAVSGGTASAQYSFAPVMGGGVSGNPGTAPASYAPGRVVPYSYAPSTGFSAAVVEVDGGPSPPSGIVSMNANHWLWAFGQPVTGTDFADYITAPNDATVIPYPQFYSGRPTSQTVRVTDPYCAVESSVIAYPDSYLGSFPMPAVSGAPLPASTLRGIDLMDVWDPNDPALNHGCSGDQHAAFQVTVARLKTLGADFVLLDDHINITDATSGTPVYDPNSREITDTELAFIGSAASAGGLNVWLAVNLSPQDDNGVSLPTAPTQEWFSALLDSYTQYIVHLATVAQANGVKAIQLDWLNYNVPLTNYSTVYVSKMTAALAQVHAVFGGLVLLSDGLLRTHPNPGPALCNGVDAIVVYSDESTYISAQAAQSLSVNSLKPIYKLLLANIANDLSDLGPSPKPVVMVGYIESNLTSLVTGPIDDFGCCVSIPTDFSVQAIAYEALLESMSESGLNFLSFFSRGYWQTDVILPKDTFPNIGTTVRNKPAESIIYQWFQKK